MTVVVLVFAEVMPKTFAIRHANQVALAVAPVMRVVVAVLGPAIHGVHCWSTACCACSGSGEAAKENVEAAMAESAAPSSCTPGGGGQGGASRHDAAAILDLVTSRSARS